MTLIRRVWEWFTHVDDVDVACCQRGHEFTPDNTYVRPDGRGRECRACRTARRTRTPNQPTYGRSQEG